MDAHTISQRLTQLAGDSGRVSCGDARRLAEDAGVEYAEIGRLCDKLGIKIHSCELGCF